MAIIASNLNLQSFYPVDLEISQIDEREDSIFIHMHSRSNTCICHKCGGLLDKHHGSHRQKKCLSPAKKYKLYKSSINKSIHFVQRSLSSSPREQRVTVQLNLSRE